MHVDRRRRLVAPVPLGEARGGVARRSRAAGSLALGLRSLAVALLLVSLCAPVRAQCELGPLLAPVPAEALAYGTSLALRDGVAVVGNGSGLFGGVPCYLFEPEGLGWSQDVVTLAPTSLTTTYGQSVGVWGDTAVVAGQDLDATSWVAYVFERVGGVWTAAGTLDVPWASPQIAGGLRTAIEDDVILVSSSMDLTVWVFERQGGDWVLTDTLQPSAAPFTVSFGFSVALRDGRAVIGGSAPNGPLDFVGTAWIFERVHGVFVEQAQLLTVGGETFDNAGVVIAQDDDTIVLGAPAHDLSSGENLNPGAAFVFERDNGVWSQTQLLSAPVPRAGDAFGMSLALQADTLLVGAPFTDEGAQNSGSVYVFRHDGPQWNFSSILRDAEPEQFAQFGRALALEDETLLVGAPYAGAGDAPAVRVLRGVPGLDDWVPSPGAVAGTSGEPCLFGHGQPVVGGAASVGLASAPGAAQAWLVLGFTRLEQPFKGGLLVPSPELLLPQVSDDFGNLELGWSWPAGVPAGTSLWLQAWIPDAGAPFGFAASNGLAIQLP